MDIAQISLCIRVWRNLNTWVQLNAYSQYRVLCCNHFPSVCELEPTSFSNMREQQSTCSGWNCKVHSEIQCLLRCIRIKNVWLLIFADRIPNCVVYLHILEELIIPVSEEAGLYVLSKQVGGPAVSHIAAGDLFDRYRLEAAFVTWPSPSLTLHHSIFFSGGAEEFCITYSECMSVALVIQHAKRMPHSILSSVARLVSAPYFFPHYLLNSTMFG